MKIAVLNPLKKKKKKEEFCLRSSYVSHGSISFKVLACAPSNVAVDNMVEKLIKGKVKVMF